MVLIAKGKVIKKYGISTYWTCICYCILPLLYDICLSNHYEVMKSLVKRDIIVLMIDESNVGTYLPGGTPSGCNWLFSLEVFDEDTKMVLSCDSE